MTSLTDRLVFVSSVLLHARSRCVCMSPRIEGEGALLAFTGTQTPKDLIFDDLDIRRSCWPDHDGFVVHRGFARRTRSILDEIQPFLESHERFILAGHSLGGACAILAASALVEQAKHVQGVYTFGTPRLGSTKFQKLYRAQGLTRITRSFATPRDPIVHKIPYIYKEVCPYEELFCDEKDAWAHHDMKAYANAMRIEDIIEL